MLEEASGGAPEELEMSQVVVMVKEGLKGVGRAVEGVGRGLKSELLRMCLQC